jgi:ACS family glucarate transporter-like MFS transporter
MMLAMTMIGCNYVSASFSVMILMCIAFFGKGIGALGWTVISDTSPRDLIGVNGGLFNLIGNLAGVTTPIVIGLIVKYTGSFHWALVFVAAAGLLAIVAYVPIVGEIKRVELSSIPAPGVSA